ncbi:hypothetical protein FD01_GL001626 [Lacticaseibacillus manihotivorans DSM 13343 = JCM 12514]|uniref:Uncharacterized protein n=1 Tax=Lacticaseibacillus manihotivorans DSM 13343 = JCM 12514 TaxID=1423769 RepID=A0A0R1R7G2_9LACO|nr:hypothetical protein FD01_GL001626 [Lacticaseibacillus manihotivorans DSM 13343 = JCM 12514]
MTRPTIAIFLARFNFFPNSSILVGIKLNVRVPIVRRSENLWAPATWRHCEKLDKLPVRPAPEIDQSPADVLLPRFKTKENHFVSKSAGRICACRQKTASYLIPLPRAIVQFSSVLPSRFHPQIFSVAITSLRIKSAHVLPSLIFLNVAEHCRCRTP